MLKGLRSLIVRFFVSMINLDKTLETVLQTGTSKLMDCTRTDALEDPALRFGH